MIGFLAKLKIVDTKTVIVMGAVITWVMRDSTYLENTDVAFVVNSKYRKLEDNQVV